MQKYEKVKVAGEGAYGVVHQCRHKETGEVVAIKAFRATEEDDEEAKKTQREVKLLRALNHENIVLMKEAFRQKGVLYLVFEFVEKCLVDILDASTGGVGHDKTRVLTCQLVRALEHCHRHGVIHRDIKPDNLLVNPADNSLRLCDFGSACKACRGAILTDYVATRWYRAPELLVRSNAYDKSVDIWGMGCVMAELAVGRPLFAGSSDIDQLCLIYTALGPLTRDQASRSLELSNFATVKYPPNGERQTLKMKLGQALTEHQMSFLESVVAVDPAHRLSAEAALAHPWLKDVQVPRTSRASTPCATADGSASTRTSARPPRPGGEHRSLPPQAPAVSSQAKPRVRRSLSQGPAQVNGACSAPATLNNVYVPVELPLAPRTTPSPRAVVSLAVSTANSTPRHTPRNSSMNSCEAERNFRPPEMLPQAPISPLAELRARSSPPPRQARHSAGGSLQPIKRIRSASGNNMNMMQGNNIRSSSLTRMS